MKHEVLLGIDTIEVVIDTQTILNKNNITFYSSNGNEVGKLVHRQGKKKGYNLILNLPRCVRQNNIQPFSVLDADKIYEITTIVVKQLRPNSQISRGGRYYGNCKQKKCTTHFEHDNRYAIARQREYCLYSLQR